MKKLLLASIIMFGICSFANAQTPEAVKAKKEAAKMNNNSTSPAITNINGVTPATATAATATTVDIDGTVVVDAKVAPTDKTDAEKTKLIDQQKAKKIEQEKAAVKKQKDN